MSTDASGTDASPRSARKIRVEEVETVTIRFAGDSGDGMQLTGDQFTATSVVIGNDVATFPDYPAEIRAPAGSLPGVSGFQVRFSNHDIHTPGDAPDVLVAMNPAALKVNLGDLRPNGILVVNADSFRETDLKLAHYDSNPLEDQSLEGYRVIKVELTRLTRSALEESALKKTAGQKAVDRCKNFFALGIMYWLYNRPLEPTLRWIQRKFDGKDALIEANTLALKGGYNYAHSIELFQVTYEVAPAHFAPGTYRNISGNTALALGLVTAAERAGLKLFYGSYPITPASDVLHELSRFKSFGVVTFQAEDEIAALGSALGASFAGYLGVSATSGPGVVLKAETMGLAVSVELPLIIVDVQRGGPSTGLPTKTEQSDLLLAMFGRHGEAPLPVLACASPGDCFHLAIEAARIATRFMTPVILLSDGYLANGAEPWKIPSLDELPEFKVRFRTDPKGYLPFLRDPHTLARDWVKPGTPGLEHRIGGLEHDQRTGNVSYDPLNHEQMTHLRADKVAGIAADIPPLDVEGEEAGDLLLLGWGSTEGAMVGAYEELRREGRSVARAHLRHLNPFPRNLGEVLKRYRNILVPELNTGQLALLLRARYLIDVISYPKMQGKPFKIAEIKARAEEILGEEKSS
jgi:2-oxoglutarate ferredoxin oxidoreductase subunit alpha